MEAKSPECGRRVRRENLVPKTFSRRRGATHSKEPCREVGAVASSARISISRVR